MDKIKPTRQSKRFEKYICHGKLRVDIKKENGDFIECKNMPKEGGCQINIEALGRFITGFWECNIINDFVKDILRKCRPCPSPKERYLRLRGTKDEIPKEEIGFGGCPKIILMAIEEMEKEENADKP